MATLVVLQDGKAVPFDLSEEEAVIGRLPECEIKLDSNMVSRRHARVFKQGPQHLLEDLGSGNGTFLNGKKIESPTALQNEDRIKIGPILLRFEAGEGAVAVGAGAGSNLSGTMIGVDLTSDDETAASATIMGTAENVSGFGRLEVQPEAKLRAVLEISRSLANTVDLESIAPKILDTLFTIFPHADRGCILLKDPKSDNMIPRAIKHRRADADETVKLSRTIMRKVLEEKTGILSADAASDSRFQASESISNLTIRSMMCVPMLSLDGEPMGIVNIDTQNPINQFKQEDLDLLLSVAGQAALSYETARLMESYVEKQKQDREMGIARGVQRALLPESLPEVEGYEFFASYEAAQAVGGDYYDSMIVNDDRMWLSFGDVAGKGVAASLVMSRLASVVQSTMDYVTDLSEAVDRINKQMCAKAVEGRFVTFVLVTIDLKTNEMTIANAGHMSPMIRRVDGTVEEFSEDNVGVPLGVIEGFPYEVERRVIEPGETVVIYTDGVSEAMNPASELYGLERLRELIRNNSPHAKELGRAILVDVKKHAAGRPQNDDITLMAFGRLAQ